MLTSSVVLPCTSPRVGQMPSTCSGARYENQKGVAMKSTPLSEKKICAVVTRYVPGRLGGVTHCAMVSVSMWAGTVTAAAPMPKRHASCGLCTSAVGTVSLSTVPPSSEPASGKTDVTLIVAW